MFMVYKENLCAQLHISTCGIWLYIMIFIVFMLFFCISVKYGHLPFLPCLVSSPILWVGQPSHQQTGSEWSPSDDYADICIIAKR